jgi:glycerol 2-dehydrogenase (NADP+)
VYKNENEVGAGLKEAFATGIHREEVFVTSKLWNTFHRRPEECLDRTLKSLALDYVDLYLMHWPVPMNGQGNDPLFPTRSDGSRDLDTEWSYVDTWKEMEKLLATGKVKAIGVSNCSVPFLEKLLEQSDVVPAVNQIENHPYLPQQEISDFCKKKGILIEAYSPLGSTGSPLFEEEGVTNVAKKHEVGAGTILISYQGKYCVGTKNSCCTPKAYALTVSKGHVVLPKSVTPARIEENLRTVKLDTTDLEALENIHKTKGLKRFVYPQFGVNLGFPDKQ